jgi:hypothetical protein
MPLVLACRYATIAVGYVTNWIASYFLHLDVLARLPAFVNAYDAGGVFATNFLPALVGLIAMAVTMARDNSTVTYAPYDAIAVNAFVVNGRTAIGQGGWQVGYGLISIAFGAIAGAVAGLCSNVGVFEPAKDASTTAEDTAEWNQTSDAIHAAAPPAQ